MGVWNESVWECGDRMAATRLTLCELRKIFSKL